MAAIIGIGTRSRYGLAQEREFYKYIPHEQSSSRYAPFDRASGDDFIPQASYDPALTSYAQLAAIRLGTERTFISLFDSSYQHILAESTPSLSLIGGRTAYNTERLILGTCIFPKERGICHCVESAPRSGNQGDESGGHDSEFIALDVMKDQRINPSELQAGLSDIRFFISVPIISPRGFKIGAITAMDTEPRSSEPDQECRQFIKDMAATVMEHLSMREATVKNRRAERMIVGLGSFVEGRSTLRDSWREAHAQYIASETSGESTEGQLNMEQQDLQELAKETGKKTLAIRQSSHRAHRSRANSTELEITGQKAPPNQATHQQIPGIEFSQDSNSARAVLAGSGLKQDSLQSSIRNVFSRAANLLRESIGAEGVMFLDANSQRFGDLVDENKRKVSGSSYDNTGSSGEDESSSSEKSSRRSISDTDQDSDNGSSRVSECLGFSSSKVSSINDEERAIRAITVPEPLFTSLIHRYPRGKIFTYNADGSVSEDSDRRVQKDSASDNANAFHNKERRPSSKQKRRPAFQRNADDLIKIFSGARNVLVLPIWDPDRKRWFAGALIWTKEPNRVFTVENEVVYTSAFANSIMAEIRRIGVEVDERAKTNLISSITHELRNPLHGILGTADILSDTAMNALQHGMVHTVESCGRTLLDTINSLLDLTFIDQYRKEDTVRNGKSRKRSNPQRNIPLGENPSISHVRLDAVLEEVTDCVFAGHCFYRHPQVSPPALTETSSRSAGQTDQADPVGPRSSQVTVIFDIESDAEWDFKTHAGAWRRILMNVFGNALKYTPSGYIYLGLKSSPSFSTASKKSPGKDKQAFDVTITVKDTGKGIGPKFLQNDLFSPFKQEDPLASGSGLGLSIVRQAVRLLGGSIEIESTVGQGTQISIHAPLMKSSTKSGSSSLKSITSLKALTEGRTMGILGFGQSLRSQRDTALFSSLERMCRQWFGLEVTNISPSESQNLDFNFYLAVQTELDCEDVEGRDIFGIARYFNFGDSHNSPVIVICQSPEEAHRMFVASKNRHETTFFEFVSQPCGPQKLTRAINMCIKRQQHRQQGRRESDEATRWVEVPQSSRLPVDIEASDPPQDRMRISKRPTAETMGNQKYERSCEGPENSKVDPTQLIISGLSANSEEGAPDKDTEENQERSVLLVDDNDVNLQLLCAYAQKDGLKYKSAGDGGQAVELFKADPGAFRAIVIDISMPIMDGFQASREIRRIERDFRAGLSKAARSMLPPTIIVALTGLDSAGAQKEALGSGINTFLVKPLKRKDFQAILRRQS